MILKGIKPELWVAMVSSVIAIAALSLAIESNSQQQRHSRLSLRPILEVGLRGEDNGVGIVIKNKGLGPALVKTFRIWHDSSEISLNDVVHRIGIAGIPNNRGFYFGRSFHITIPQGERQEVLWYAEKEHQYNQGLSPHSAVYEGIASGLFSSRFYFDECYCSVYDECWHGTVVGEDEVVVKNCDNFKSSVSH
jgi:hypothetical protein